MIFEYIDEQKIHDPKHPTSHLKEFDIMVETPVEENVVLVYEGDDDSSSSEEDDNNDNGKHRALVNITVFVRSSLINFACIRVAPPRLSHRKQKAFCLRPAA